MTRRGIAIGAIALLAAGLAPLFGSGYVVRLLTSVFMYAALGQAWNLIGGYTGYPAFGNTVFFGIGAYATALVMLAGVPFPIGLLVAAIVCPIVAAGIGWPVLRLRGHYFAIATLGIGEAAREIVLNAEPLGAPGGLSLPIARDYALFYYLMLGMVFVLALTTHWLEGSRTGYALLAIRESEEAAAAMGIDTNRYKVLAFALSALFTGVVGGIYSYWVTFIDPTIVFTPAVSVQAILVALLGGPGTVIGPILGALVLETAAGLIWANFLSWHDAFLGSVIMLVVLFLPRGMTSLYPFRRPSLATLLEHVRSSRV